MWSHNSLQVRFAPCCKRYAARSCIKRYSVYGSIWANETTTVHFSRFSWERLRRVSIFNLQTTEQAVRWALKFARPTADYFLSRYQSWAPARQRKGPFEEKAWRNRPRKPARRHSGRTLQTSLPSFKTFFCETIIVQIARQTSAQTVCLQRHQYTATQVSCLLRHLELWHGVVGRGGAGTGFFFKVGLGLVAMNSLSEILLVFLCGDRARFVLILFSFWAALPCCTSAYVIC